MILFAPPVSANSVCNDTARLLAGWDRAADDWKFDDGTKSLSLQNIQDIYSASIEKLSIEDLSHLREIGAEKIHPYLLISPELFTIGLKVKPSIIRLLRETLERTTIKRIRALAFAESLAGRGYKDLIETPQKIEFLPLEFGGSQFISPRDKIFDTFTTVTKQTQLSNGSKVSVGNTHPDSGTARIAVSGIKGQKRVDKIFSDISVFDTMDVSASEDYVSAAGLTKDGRGRIILFQMEGLKSSKALQVETPTEPVHLTMISDTTLLAVFEKEIITYTIDQGRLKPLQKDQLPQNLTVTAAAHSTDKKLLFIGFSNGARMLVNTESFDFILLSNNLDRISAYRHTDEITEIGTTADGSAYFLSRKDGVISRWAP